MNSLKENIIKIAGKVADLKNLLLIDVILRGNERNRVIEIFVDGEKNISADDCAEFSRLINKIFEEKELIKTRYRLDVSSPGVDRPLIFLKQFPKHLNRTFDITYQTGEEKKKFIGKLIKIDGELLTFKVKQELVVNFNKIIKAEVKISFS
ncbi:ribosome maturation factor RimP [bacterium BMS3Abin03]|nr:ribosome maturation factor RimP [bacterium BMS3Abin03]